MSEGKDLRAECQEEGRKWEEMVIEGKRGRGQMGKRIIGNE